MEVSKVLERLKRLKVETKSLACMGCGHEHNCGINGCRIIREAIQVIEELSKPMPDCEELVRRLRNTESRSKGELLREAALTIEKLCAEKERRAWIGVKEPPQKAGKYLVYLSFGLDGYMDTAWYTACYAGCEEHLRGKAIWYDHDSEYGDYELRNVTHWMPLPELPKGGAEE